MKLMFLSDTHGNHNSVLLNDFIKKESPDIILHSGDCSMKGSVYEIRDFMDWYGNLPVKYKVFIAGNHDFLFDKEHVRCPLNSTDGEPEDYVHGDVFYLNDTSVTIEGLKIHGSPVQPWFHNWAFNRQPGPDIEKHWALIPDDTEILLTHGPVYGIHDKVVRGDFNVGCPSLGNTITERLRKLVVHSAGHIHEGYGYKEFNGVAYVNCSLLNIYYYVTNQPIVVVLDEDKKIVDYSYGGI